MCTLRARAAGKHKLTVKVLSLITGGDEVWFGGRHVPQGVDVLAGDFETGLKRILGRDER